MPQAGSHYAQVINLTLFNLNVYIRDTGVSGLGKEGKSDYYAYVY